MIYISPGTPIAPGLAELWHLLLWPVGVYNFSVREKCFLLQARVYFHVYRSNIQTDWLCSASWLPPQRPLLPCFLKKQT